MPSDWAIQKAKDALPMKGWPGKYHHRMIEVAVALDSAVREAVRAERQAIMDLACHEDMYVTPDEGGEIHAKRLIAAIRAREENTNAK